MRPGEFKGVEYPEDERLKKVITHMNLLGALGETVLRHRLEARSIENLLQESINGGLSPREIVAPKGTVFAITSGDGEFEFSASSCWGGWNYLEKIKFEKGGDNDAPTFLAEYIAIDDYEGPDGIIQPAVVFAHSQHGPMRCKINGSNYDISLRPMKRALSQPHEFIVNRLIAGSFDSNSIA